MKVDRRPESIPITESPSVALELLDHRVEALGAGICRAGHHRGDDAVEVTFDHSSDLLDRLQPRANRPVVPFLPAAPGPAAGSVVPQTHRVGLDRPRPGGLQIGRFQVLEGKRSFPAVLPSVESAE